MTRFEINDIDLDELGAAYNFAASFGDNRDIDIYRRDPVCFRDMFTQKRYVVRPSAKGWRIVEFRLDKQA